MCRFIAYMGPEILLEELLIKPSNSLLVQSLNARETRTPTNGDGFGIGWYKPEIDSNPGIFNSVSPAWNDSNLCHLTAKLLSPCFFAHVRAATQGGVSYENCHPFTYEDMLYMHNGNIGDFHLVKRHLRRLLDDDIYNWVKGDTDSEHFFGLFLQNSKHLTRPLTTQQLVETLKKTILQIFDLVAFHSPKANSFINACITNGKSIVASRVSSNIKKRPRTLYYSHPKQTDEKLRRPILIVSERLSELDGSEWHKIPAQSLISIDEKENLVIEPFYDLEDTE